MGEYRSFLRDPEDAARHLAVRAERSATRGGLVRCERRAACQRTLGPIAPGDALWEFAEAVFEAFDVGQRVSVAAVAKVMGVDETTACYSIAELRALGCWPYRPARRGVFWDDEKPMDLRGDVA